MGEPSGKPWPSSQRRQQIRYWFGLVPSFILTLDAVFLSTAHPLQACALVEHELLHAGYERDAYGGAKRSTSGRLNFTVRAHDVEAFTSEVALYGAWSPDLEEFARAILAGPKFERGAVEGFCGCGARVG